jgi:hypothetical protein
MADDGGEWQGLNTFWENWAIADVDLLGLKRSQPDSKIMTQASIRRP